MTRTRSLSALAAPVLAAAVVLAGCGLSTPDEVISPTDAPSSAPAAQDGAPTEGDAGAPTEGDEQSDADRGAEESNDRIDPVAAGETALGAHPGGRVYDLELERSRGVTAWEVTVVTGEGKFEVDVDAVTGEILRDRPDHTSSLAKYNSRLDRASLSYADAIEVALGAHPGATIGEMELDEDHGELVWEMEIISGDHVKYDLDIHAVTGEILKDERDD